MTGTVVIWYYGSGSIISHHQKIDKSFSSKRCERPSITCREPLTAFDYLSGWISGFRNRFEPQN
jgi:hypothetical protein